MKSTGIETYALHSAHRDGGIEIGEEADDSNDLCDQFTYLHTSGAMTQKFTRNPPSIKTKVSSSTSESITLIILAAFRQ